MSLCCRVAEASTRLGGLKNLFLIISTRTGRRSSCQHWVRVRPRKFYQCDSRWRSSLTLARHLGMGHMITLARHLGMGHIITLARHSGMGHVITLARHLGMGHMITLARHSGMGHMITLARHLGMGHMITLARHLGMGHMITLARHLGMGHMITLARHLDVGHMINLVWHGAHDEDDMQVVHILPLLLNLPVGPIVAAASSTHWSLCFLAWLTATSQVLLIWFDMRNNQQRSTAGAIQIEIACGIHKLCHLIPLFHWPAMLLR